MANYPGAIDSAASLYTPVDAFSAKPLETTTTGAVLAGDSDDQRGVHAPEASPPRTASSRLTTN